MNCLLGTSSRLIKLFHPNPNKDIGIFGFRVSQDVVGSLMIYEKTPIASEGVNINQ